MGANHAPRDNRAGKRGGVTSVLPRDRIEPLQGFGGAETVAGYVFRPSNVSGIREAFVAARAYGVPVALRGAGKSYGDAAYLREAVTLDLTRLNRVLDWNPDTGVLTVEPGVTIRQAWQTTVGDGWLPPVVSGTMYSTIGGALAMNIHGKNHYKHGTLGENTLSFDLLLPGGDHLTCTPSNENRDLFYAAIGGFGVLGVFTTIRLQMMSVQSGLMRVRQFAARNLTELFAVTDREIAGGSDYTVGWLDPFASGTNVGRGLVQTASFLPEGHDPAPAQTLRADRQDLGDTALGVPKSVLWQLLKPWVNDAGMRVLSALRYRLGAATSGKAGTDTWAGANFLLDYVPHWQNAYGSGGLMQYQTQIPATAAPEAVAEQLRLCHAHRLFPYLSVFKRHRADPFLMSYSVDGYSLALDFKVTSANRDRLWNLAGELDAVTIAAGGRFYFAKDATLHPSRIQAFLGEARVQTFREIKRRVDPQNLLQTDLYRRIFG
ncbi:MAG: FAD-binding oxidoreductase [Armatimonadetes bacterium]|nr:FAD-binding oxidoreductase [Armatimonadota bacterium]